jgi:hypothetical protein
MYIHGSLSRTCICNTRVLVIAGNPSGEKWDLPLFPSTAPITLHMMSLGINDYSEYTAKLH